MRKLDNKPPRHQSWFLLETYFRFLKSILEYGKD
jgi:hypothetical protein